MLDKDLKLISVNHAAAKTWGYPEHDLIGQPFTKFAGADEALLLEVQQGNGDKQFTAGGFSWTLNWVHIYQLMVCTAQEDDNKLLHSLEKSIERFEYVTQATTDIIWDWDLETNEVYYSGNIQRSFGHKPGINVGDMRFFAQYVHPDDRERVVLYPDPVKYGTMNYWTEKYRFQKADGEYAFVLDKGVVIRDAQGVGIRMIGAMQDITELKNSELQIARQNAQLVDHSNKLNKLNLLKDRLIAILAHDLRGPLSSLRSVFELFQDDTISSGELLTMIPGVVKKLDYTSDFLDTLLFWVNTQMENFEKAITSFSLQQVVAKESQNLYDLAAKKSLHLMFSIADDLVAFADPDSVRIIIRNLVTNAIKFTNEQGLIEVNATRKNGMVMVTVKDSGTGMDPEQLARLFKGKMDSKRGTNDELGTGMGLLFCKDLIEKCKGEIWVTTQPGIGTEFSFSLPEGSLC